jgi:acyl carrier protein
MASQEEIFGVVKESLAAALGTDEEEITPEAALSADLGAESLDILDVLFRIEKKLGVKVAMADLTSRLQGDLSPEEFADPSGKVTRAGLMQLKTVLPQIDVAGLEGKLEADGLFSLLTVGNLVDIVVQKQATKSAS